MDHAAWHATHQKLEKELKALLHSMDEQQQFRFKQAVVRQSIHYIEGLLPPEEDNVGHRIGIDLARRWLATPTKETASWVGGVVASENQDGGARYFDYPPYFLDPAIVAIVDDGWDAAQVAAWVGLYKHEQKGVIYKDRKKEGENRTAATLVILARLEWQIAAAQAILNDEPLPPLE